MPAAGAFPKALEIYDNVRANTHGAARIRKALQMGKIPYFTLGCLMATSALAADAVDEDRPYGRVCLSVFEPGPPAKEEAFQISTPAAAGKILGAYVDASGKSSGVVAAVTTGGELPTCLRPQPSGGA